MCGIAGWVLPAGQRPGNALERMAVALAHRGPDDQGFFMAGAGQGAWQVALAHRRLSILDLGGGHQPMADASGTVTIVFNGEIYNFEELRGELEGLGHRFATRSDTEVILGAWRQWGEACPGRLRGMFAFALWDARQEVLFLARDRFGKKPLFLLERPEGLCFASEIKALFEAPGAVAAVATERVADYLAFRYVPGPATLFAGVHKLPPGSSLTWRAGRVIPHTYFRPADREPLGAPLMPEDPVGAFLERLEEAVRIRMVCDVPYGAFLSGGIDSSAVVGLMARLSPYPVKTFAVGFREQRYSELRFAADVARRFGTEHQELVITEQDIRDQLEHITWLRDAPVSEASDVPIFLLAREAARSVKMVLTGEGSDEFLGGYPKHVFERWAGPYQRIPRVLRHSLIEPLAHSLPYRFRRAKTAIGALGLERPEERLPRWFGGLSPAEQREFYRGPPYVAPVAAPPFDAPPGNSALRRILYFDQASWLPDNLLERGDRMTMGASIEGRMPFLDHELAAFVSRLPDRFRVRGRSGKWILRQAMRGILPAGILERPKVGFRVPVNEWFRTSLREYLADHVLGGDSFLRDLFHRAALERVVGEHLRGEQNHERTLWCLLNLDIWHRRCVRPASGASS